MLKSVLEYGYLCVHVELHVLYVSSMCSISCKSVIYAVEIGKTNVFKLYFILSYITKSFVKLNLCTRIYIKLTCIIVCYTLLAYLSNMIKLPYIKCLFYTKRMVIFYQPFDIMGLMAADQMTLKLES